MRKRSPIKDQCQDAELQVVEDENGTRKGLRFKMSQRQSFIALTKKDIRELEKVDSIYLIGELQDRGFDVFPRDEQPALAAVLDLLISHMEAENLGFEELKQDLVDRAKEQCLTQKEISNRLRISERMVSYYTNQRKQRLERKALQAAQLPAATVPDPAV